MVVVAAVGLQIVRLQRLELVELAQAQAQALGLRKRRTGWKHLASLEQQQAVQNRRHIADVPSFEVEEAEVGLLPRTGWPWPC